MNQHVQTWIDCFWYKVTCFCDMKCHIMFLMWLDMFLVLFCCHMKIDSQNDFTSKTAKINHVRSNSKFQIKSIQHDFIFLSLIWFFLQTLILGLNFNVWQEINCQRKKIQIKNFTSDLKFPIKGSNSKFHITWLLNFDKKFTSWPGKEGLICLRD